MPGANAPRELVPVPIVADAPAAVPFTGPERLARTAGFDVAELLRLGANESCFGPAPAVAAALEEGLSSIGNYGDPDVFALRTALAERAWSTPEGVLVASGIDELLGLFVRAYLPPGESAVTTLGSYPTFAYHVHGYGGVLETVPYLNAAPDTAALARKAREVSARIVYLANPDNPSGALLGAAAVEAFVRELAPSTLVLLDEAYAEYAPEALPQTLPANVVRLRTFSKAYGLAGMRVGYAFADPEILRQIEKIRLHFGVGRAAQLAALTALERPAYVTSVLAENQRGRRDYEQYALELGLQTYPSATNFVLFELGDAGRAERLVAELFRRKVFVRKPIAGELASCVRITVGAAADRRRLRGGLQDALAAVDARPGA